MWIRTVGLAMMLAVPAFAQAADYKVLATSKTSTMRKEMNDAAANGYRFENAMGGKTSAGKEVVVIMSKDSGAAKHLEYRLLATSKTSTMQKELQQAGDAGFTYRDQTVFDSAFGGEEVVVILERDRDAATKRYEYKLLATTRTSTMEKELQDAASKGYEFVGMAIGKTAFGGEEIVTIVRRETRVADR